MNGLEAFNDIKAKLKTGTDECGSKKHSTNHGTTHIKGYGTPDLLDEQFALLTQYWETYKKSALTGYATWECASSGSYGSGAKTGKEMDFCVRCDKCEKATGFSKVKKSPTFVYHVNVVPAQVSVQPSAPVTTSVISTPKSVEGPAPTQGPSPSVKEGKEFKETATNV